MYLSVLSQTGKLFYFVNQWENTKNTQILKKLVEQN